MFRYSYDEMEGDTVIFEREIIHPNISKWLKVITFIGENRKAIAIAAVLFLVLLVALVVSLVVTSASDAGLNVDSQRGNFIYDNCTYRLRHQFSRYCSSSRA